MTLLITSTAVTHGIYLAKIKSLGLFSARVSIFHLLLLKTCSRLLETKVEVPHGALLKDSSSCHFHSYHYRPSIDRSIQMVTAIAKEERIRPRCQEWLQWSM